MKTAAGDKRMDGILNIYKEAGYTSHDVVAKLRGILKQRRIGHTGTLDPDAEGVLPVCLGSATKLCDMLTDRDKVYRAVLLLGVTTDTLDTSGRVLHECPVKASADEVRAAILRFVGGYDQVPPMYSALKVNGKKLYELARQGKEVERAPRRVEIYDICIEEISCPRVVMTVHCGKGTYIRALCQDIGNSLGCGGCMEKLERLAACGFTADSALRLSEVERLQSEGKLESRLISSDDILKDLPALQTNQAADRLVHNGNRLEDRNFLQCRNLLGQARVYDSAGTFMGIYGRELEEDSWKPVKMFLGS